MGECVAKCRHVVEREQFPMTQISDAQTDSKLFDRQDSLSAEQELKALKLIFEHIGEGSCVINGDGIITHFNEAYGRFLDIDLKKTDWQAYHRGS